jgi:D-alanyl-D-alanine carboxypeptidase
VRTQGRWWPVVTALVALAVGLVGGAALGAVVQGDPDPAPPAIGELLGSGPAPPASEGVQPLTPDTLLAWTPGGLPPGLEEAVRRLPAVDHAVAVVSGVAWLTRSSAPDGTTIDRTAGGLALPVEVAAANLTHYAPFLAPPDRSVLPRLSEGEAALGETSAAIRRMEGGGTLAFGDRTLQVAAVLPDTAIGAHEVFMSRATAATLGLVRERYLLVDPADGASREDLTARIRSLIPPGQQVRVRGPGETPVFRQGDAVLPPVRLKEVFGEFAARPTGGYLHLDPKWVEANIVHGSVPLLGTIACHRAFIPQLRGALEEVRSQGLGRLVDPGGYGGCYSPRFVNRNPSAGISHHTWGIAVDINVPENRFGQTPHQDPRLVAIFERWGFTWGGRWLLPDGMHFEWVSFPAGG